MSEIVEGKRPEQTATWSSAAGTLKRSACLLGLVLVFLLQKPVEVRHDLFPSDVRRLVGYALSALLPLLLAGYAFWRRPAAVWRSGAWLTERWTVAVVASIGVVLTAGSEWTYGYVLALPVPLPRPWAAAIVLGWTAVVFRLLVAERPAIEWLWTMTGVAILLRAIGIFLVDVPSGDMLPVVDRALDRLLAGGQPYQVYPPAMPYFPLTLATYLPAKLLGLDLRWANVVVEALVPIVAFLPRRHEPTSLEHLVVPAFMLLPFWTVYGLDTTFAATLLAIVLLGQAVWSWPDHVLAVVLGAAIAANQTLVVLAPFVGALWLRERGAVAAIRLTALSIAVPAVTVLPFFVWEPGNFIEATTGMATFDGERFAGRFSLRPLLDGVASWAPLSAMLLAGVSALAVARRLRDRRDWLPVAGIAYCVVLLLLHRSFSHYFLPVLVLVLAYSPSSSRVAPASSQCSLRRGRAGGLA
jgi:hypothetical protein